MDHQDWKQVVITGKSTKTLAQKISEGTVKRDIVSKKDGGKNSQSMAATDVKILDTDDIVVPQITNRAVGEQIRDSRTSETNKQGKKLTQTQLDALCNFPSGTVQKYENNTAIYRQQEVDKMSKVLGVVIRKHAK